MHYLFTFVMNINIESKKYIGRKHFPLTSKEGIELSRNPRLSGAGRVVGVAEASAPGGEVN